MNDTFAWENNIDSRKLLLIPCLSFAMGRSIPLKWVLRRLRKLGIVKFMVLSIFLCILLPISLLLYYVSHSISPLTFLLREMHEPKTVIEVLIPSANASLVVIDMVNEHDRLVERWLYVRYGEDRSDEELGYGLIWPKPGISGLDRFDTSTWASDPLSLPSGEMCNDVLILLRISNKTMRYNRLSFGLNNGILHSFHASTCDNGTLVTVEQSTELIQVSRRWFSLVTNPSNIVVNQAYGDWIDEAERKNVVYDQIFIREREETDGTLVYYPKRVFTSDKNVKKLYEILATNGFIVVFIARLDKSETEDIISTYKSFFGKHCKLIKPSKTQNRYLLCQKTNKSAEFKIMHQSITSFIDASC